VESVEKTQDDNLPVVSNFAFCVAIVLSDTDPERAAAMTLRLECLWPHVHILTGQAKIPFDRLALWLCADHHGVNHIRHDRLRTAGNDQALAIEVLCAEYANKRNIVIAYAETLLRSDNPADAARGITLVGFCDSDDRIRGLFEHTQYAYGFLADAARKARKAYERNAWARHWFLLARNSDNPTEYWRYSELMIKSADARFALWFPGPLENVGMPFSSFHLMLKPRLKERAKEKAQGRHDSLFGIRPPSNHLLSAVGLRRGT